MAGKRGVLTGFAVASLAAAVSGCIGGGPAGPRMGAAPAPTVEGSWVDAQGTGLSTLSGGVFQTTASDTGQKLAEGSYRMTGADSVQITGTSLIRQSPISFNCLMVASTRLNCTSSSGQQFVLTRRGTA